MLKTHYANKHANVLRMILDTSCSVFSYIMASAVANSVKTDKIIITVAIWASSSSELRLTAVMEYAISNTVPIKHSTSAALADFGSPYQK